MTALSRFRETLVVGLIAILIGLTVYTRLGLAWAFKTTVESSQKLRHHFTRMP